jgi:hypothetical protein
VIARFPGRLAQRFIVAMRTLGAQRDQTIEVGVSAALACLGLSCTTAGLTGRGTGAASQAQFP